MTGLQLILDNSTAMPQSEYIASNGTSKGATMSHNLTLERDPAFVMVQARATCSCDWRSPWFTRESDHNQDEADTAAVEAGTEHVANLY
jgi:hypothetical protein